MNSLIWVNPVRGSASARRSPSGVHDACERATSYAQKTMKDEMVGTWRIVVPVATRSAPLGGRQGADVSMSDRTWLPFVDSTRKSPVAAAPTDAGAMPMMKSYLAGIGKCMTVDQTPDGLKITAHVDAASNEAVGTDRVYICVDGDTRDKIAGRDRSVVKRRRDYGLNGDPHTRQGVG